MYVCVCVCVSQVFVCVCVYRECLSCLSCVQWCVCMSLCVDIHDTHTHTMVCMCVFACSQPACSHSGVSLVCVSGVCVLCVLLAYNQSDMWRTSHSDMCHTLNATCSVSICHLCDAYIYLRRATNVCCRVCMCLYVSVCVLSVCVLCVMVARVLGQVK